MRLEITGFAGGGRGLARGGGKVWFVAGALPGEVVEAGVERERAGIVEARAEEVVVASLAREPAPCPVAGACGGCDLAHVRRAAASAALRDIAIGALRHSPPVLADAVREAPVRASEMAWRLRARLHWDSARKVLGFRTGRSHAAVEISPCRVVSPLLLRTLPELAAALERGAARDGELDWIEDLAAERAVAGWWGGTVPDGPVGELAGFHPLAAGAAIAPGGWGDRGVVMQLPRPLHVPAGAFFQGNRHLVPGLFARVSEIVRAVGPARVVDLYGGVGFLSAAARDGGAAAVTLVEASAPAAAAARRNLPEVTVTAAPAEAFLSSPGPASGTLAIVDPPRTGLSRVAGEGLVRWRPERVVLLACDAARFGRDGARLLAAGYVLESVELWDLFAGSHHVEVLASFGRGAR
ncbi:MAG: class I SAM-dependent RNA methyltransferase [Acidobacteria bacterium]|nr:MAG: class I SAM-dependent RNA methyltransferase [Acidobacteriota bacterium]